MMRQTRPVHWVLASLSVMAVSVFASMAGTPSPGFAAAAPESDPALGRTRAPAKMLADLFKVAVVGIRNLYDGPPAAKVAKAIFAAAEEKQYFNAKLLD